MYQRGQVTMFIVIGLLVLGVFVGVYFLVSSGVTSSVEGETSGSDALGLSPRVKAYVEGCMRDVAVPGLYLLGAQGGVIEAKDFSRMLVSERSLIQYASDSEQFYLTKELVETELSNYLRVYSIPCFNFSSFKSEGYAVNVEDKLIANVNVLKDTVLIEIIKSISFTKGTEVIEINSFRSEIQIPLGRMIEDAHTIANLQQSSSYVSLSDLGSFQEFVTVTPYDDFTTVYSLHDKSVFVDGAPYVFYFAVYTSGENTAPVLDYIADFVLQRSVRFSARLYASDAEKNGLTYSSDNDLFPVVPTGEIEFVPSQVGEYDVTFTVTDGDGLTDSQQVHVRVVE